MRYRRDGDWHIVTRITGPTHNLLGLLLSVDRRRHEPTQIEAWPGTTVSVGGSLAPAEVLAAVHQGAQAANSALGTDFFVLRVRYVPADSPPASVYEQLAWHAVEQAAAERGEIRRHAAG